MNVHAPYHSSVEAARRMPEGGRIIVNGSVNGDRMLAPGMAVCALGKSALLGMGRGISDRAGSRLTSCSRGRLIRTPTLPTGLRRTSCTAYGDQAPRAGPQEVAGMTAWLADPEAGFVTGARHTIDVALGA